MSLGAMLAALIVLGLIAIGVGGYTLWFFLRTLYRDAHQSIKEHKQQKQTAHTTLAEQFGALVYLLFGLALIFIIGVVILAVIKWAFQVVF